MKNINSVNTVNAYKKKLREEVEGMKVDGETPFGHQELHETELSYNQP